jgi:predicted anti-sigma-YlaC factor YlaD
MNCKYIQTRLSVYLDGELSGSDSLLIRDHLSTCIECQAELKQIKTVSNLLSCLPPVPEPDDLMIERMLQKAMPSAKPKKVPWLGIAACSAIVCAMLYATFFKIPQQAAVQDEHEAIERAITKDRLRDAGMDSFAGASLVHTTSYQPR